MLVIEKKRKPKIQKIPPHLIYEEMNGKPLYYKGYKAVLSGKKNLSEIMGCSSLQSVLVYVLGLFIGNNLNRKKYQVASNEAGLHLSLNENLASDIAIFDKDKIVLDDKYFTVPPKVVIEVDFKKDLAETERAANRWNNEIEYLLDKSQKLLDFGVERIIWITTKAKKIFVITPSDKWYVVNYQEDILVLDDCVLNIAKLLEEEGIAI
jgi:Uma2 family endonuclease